MEKFVDSKKRPAKWPHLCVTHLQFRQVDEHKDTIEKKRKETGPPAGRPYLPIATEGINGQYPCVGTVEPPEWDSKRQVWSC